jgi:mRNA interferase RelE/StbE
MGDYQISFTRSARKELQSLPSAIAHRILIKVESLAKEPRPAACRKLRGPTNLWRLRIGEYRVVYDIDDKNCIIDVMIIRHRSEAYR